MQIIIIRFPKRSTKFTVNVIQWDDPIIGYRLLKMRTVSSMSHAATGMRCNKFTSSDAKGRYIYIYISIQRSGRPRGMKRDGERGRDYAARVVHELMRLHLIEGWFSRENRVGAFPLSREENDYISFIRRGSADNARRVYLSLLTEGRVSLHTGYL